MKIVGLIASLFPVCAFALTYSYDFVVLGDYYPPSYQHTIAPDKEYKPLIEEKPRPNVKLSIPVFKNTGKPVATVYFDFDSHRVKPMEKKKLKGIRGNVILKGYASPEGSDKYNLQLSKKRISSVKKLMKGVKVIKEEAFGERKCKLDRSKWHLCRKVEIIKINHE